LLSGSQSYLSYCASCHQLDGKGLAGVIPSLAGNGLVKSQRPENVIQVVLNGLGASRGLAPMPAVGAGMSDNEIVDAVNYIRVSWGNGAPANASSGTVGDLRANTRSLLAGNRCPPIVEPCRDRQEFWHRRRFGKNINRRHARSYRHDPTRAAGKRSVERRHCQRDDFGLVCLCRERYRRVCVRAGRDAG
jgi:Cytochrome C oxidase, cbb3-type, subunit III